LSSFFFLKDINTCTCQQKHVKLMKRDKNTFTLKKFQFQNKCCYFELCIHQGILSSTTVFNFDNIKKYYHSFFSSKSSYKNDFWRIMWLWRRV